MITLTSYQQAVYDAVTLRPTRTHFVQPAQRAGAYPAAGMLRGVLDELQQLGLVAHILGHGWVRTLNIEWQYPDGTSTPLRHVVGVEVEWHVDDDPSLDLQ